MVAYKPRTQLNTHEVTNQPPPLEDYNLFTSDQVLRETLAGEGAGWAEEKVSAFGAAIGTAESIANGYAANRYPPELKVFDRWGQRIDEVAFHPSYHALMELALAHEVHSIAWSATKPGGHVAHAALEFMLIQIEAGICCPITMTYAALASLRNQPDVAQTWEDKILSTTYDPRCMPMIQKRGVMLGMAMTEKQGGSDVRANSTKAVALEQPGSGQPYALTGHKWFCSAPMCDAFLTLAYTEKGLSCFLVPRWRPDGTRNTFLIQRLKDKLGNHANASSEIEYNDTWAQMIGEEGRGVRTIIEMVHHTRLDCTIGASGLMRQSLVQAIHHAQHRRAFGKLLIDQPLMKNVLADLALECEAATRMTMRVARAYDEGSSDEEAAKFGRIATAVSKYWTNKRVVAVAHEAMECLGGAGYVEESPMPRLYREAPLNGIWEGSGNVICLDVLRAMQREPESVEVFIASLEQARGAQKAYDATLDQLKDQLADHEALQMRARRLVEHMALTFQASLLIQHAPAAVADAFCATRLEQRGGYAFGTLPHQVDCDAILARAIPQA